MSLKSDQLELGFSIFVIVIVLLIIDFAGVTTKLEHLFMAVTYVSWHNK